MKQNLAALVTKQNVTKALNQAIREKRVLRKSSMYRIVYKEQVFPPKEIVRMAADIQRIPSWKDNKRYSLHGGKRTNNELIKLGFQIYKFAAWTKTNKGQRRSFEFKSGRASKSLMKRSFKREAKIIQSQAIHDEIQQLLFDYLENKHGKENVGMEKPAGNGNRTDISVETKRGITIYEVKAYKKPALNIRNAIGQLMEYALYPNPINKIDELVIVSNLPLSKTDLEFLNNIRQHTSLKFFYQQVNLRSKVIYDKQ